VITLNFGWGEKAVMEKDDCVSKTETLPATAHTLTRREWVHRMLAGAGAGVAGTALVEASSAHSAASAESIPDQSGPREGKWTPAFFDEHQNQTLVALAERLVPGSTAAQVNRFLDFALSAETQEIQRKFVVSLNSFDGESLRRFTRSFKDLSADQQNEILSVATTAPPSDPKNDASGEETGVETHPLPPDLRDYFNCLKDWISMAYYSSEVGMKELGWTGENFFESFPGCTHADGHP
jgi:hypothetical protein